jgi:glucose-6-phosphate isomerase
VATLRARFATEAAQGKHAYFDLPDDDEGLERVLRIAQSRMGRFRHLVVLGIGGSALGLRAVVAALAKPGQVADLHIVDSTDPWLFADVLARIELKHALFVVISKSGGTLETVAALGFFVEKLRAAKLPVSDHLIAVTDPESGPLRAFADAQGVETAEIPAAVGGRFSVLTAAGLLPAALLNVDIAGVLRGAGLTRQLCAGADPAQDWPARLGLCAMDLCRLGKTSLVFMPYSAPLREFAHWFVQLWDESLGKEANLDGKKVNSGQTVIPAVGPTDQHSQMQLFLDGPNDKLLVFVRVQQHESDFKLGEFDWGGFGAEYVRGRSLGEMIDSQLAGTVQACTQKGRANATLTLPRLDASSLGELIMGLQVATSIAGMSIGVNAYDQPAVELGKHLSRRMLGGK